MVFYLYEITTVYKVREEEGVSEICMPAGVAPLGECKSRWRKM